MDQTDFVRKYFHPMDLKNLAGFLVLTGLAAWLVVEWLRSLAYAISSWGLWSGLFDSVPVFRIATIMILMPLGYYLWIVKRDERASAWVSGLMWAGALLAGISYLGLRGRIGWSGLALAVAVLGLVVPAFIRLRTGCLARLLPPAGLVSLILLASLADLGGFLLHGYAVAPYPAPVPRRAGTLEARRQQDVRYLGTELARLHMNAFHTIPEELYWEDLSHLEAAAPGLSEAELALEMMRFVAAIGDAHTSYSAGGQAPLRGVPVDLAWYGDQLYVRGISEDYPQAVGLHVLKIGALEAEAVFQAVLPYIAHENDAWARVQSSQYLNLVDLLVKIGAAGSVDEPVPLTLEDATGETQVVAIAPLELGQTVNFLSARQKRPFYQSRPDEYFWYEYRPDSDTLYFRYAACVDLLAFRKMADEFWKLADEQPVQRVIIDLRGNGGGNTFQFDQFFFPKLKAHPELDDPERLFVLIDRRTFSSASDHAARLSQQTRATLAGEPTGGRPNGYGEVRSFRLPNSGARVNYSTNYFQSVPGDPPSIEPDLLIYAPAEAVFQGQDPVLEAVAPEEDW